MSGAGDYIPRAATFEETMERLSKAAQEYGDDFRVKVTRRQTTEGLEQSVAILAGARLNHFSAPETWLVQLAGGGPYYAMWIWPEKDPSRLLAKIPTSMISGPSKEVDVLAPTRPNWSGPSVLIYPTASERAAGAQLPGGGLGPAASHTDRNPSGTAAGHFPDSSGGASAEIARAQAQLTEARMQLQMDAIRAESAAAAKRMEQSIAQMAELVKTVLAAGAQPQQRPPEKSIAEQLAILAGAFAPILAPLISRGESDKKFFAELEEKREARAAQSLADRDKFHTAMMEKISNSGAESAKTVAAMAEVVGASMRTQLQTIATLQDLRPNEPQEEGWVGIVKEGVRAFAEVAVARGTPGQPALPPAAGGGTGANGSGQPAGQSAEQSSDDASGVPLDKADPQEIMASIVDELKAKAEPREVAEFYLDALRANPGFVALVKQRGGTGKAFQAALGAWIVGEGNAKYLGSVLQALTVVAKEQGVTV